MWGSSLICARPIAPTVSGQNAWSWTTAGNTVNDLPDAWLDVYCHHMLQGAILRECTGLSTFPIAAMGIYPGEQAIPSSRIPLSVATYASCFVSRSGHMRLKQHISCTVANVSYRTLPQNRKTLRKGLHAPCPAFRVRGRTPPWTKRMPQARNHDPCAAMRTQRGTSCWRESCDGLWTFTSDGARVCSRLRCIAPHAMGSDKH